MFGTDYVTINKTIDGLAFFSQKSYFNFGNTLVLPFSHCVPVPTLLRKCCFMGDKEGLRGHEYVQYENRIKIIKGVCVKLLCYAV